MQTAVNEPVVECVDTTEQTTKSDLIATLMHTYAEAGSYQMSVTVSAGGSLATTPRLSIHL